MRCKNCGRKLSTKEKFCTVCGYYNTEEEKSNNNVNMSVIDNESNEDLTLFDDDGLDVFEKDDFEVELPPSSPFEESVDEQPFEEFSLKADASGTKENEFYYKDEKFLESYIGEDYKLIKKAPFNIYACLLNWAYILYRKMYVVGIIGLIITGVIIKICPKYLLAYAIITMLLLGLAFNKLYVFISKIKVEHLLKKNEGTDSFTMESICEKQGGVSVRNALIIYFIFLLIVFFSLFKFSFNKSYNKKYWDENNENRATCISLVKASYKDLDNNPVTGTISEAICAIDKTTKKEYRIYLKHQNGTKVTYVHYKTEKGYLSYSDNTEDLESLETKNVNQTITEQEKEKLKAKNKISDDYLTASKKAMEEDKLIKTKKNTSEKLNYIFSKEEIIR